MSHEEAESEANHILRDEANLLAHFMESPENKDSLPHRVKVSIRREIERLRAIAELLTGEKGKTE